MLLVPIIAEILFISLKNNTHIKKQIEKMCSWTECCLVSLDILKHNEGLRRNGGSAGF